MESEQATSPRGKALEARKLMTYSFCMSGRPVR